MSDARYYTVLALSTIAACALFLTVFYRDQAGRELDARHDLSSVPDTGPSMHEPSRATVVMADQSITHIDGVCRMRVNLYNALVLYDSEGLLLFIAPQGEWLFGEYMGKTRLSDLAREQLLDVQRDDP